MEIDYGALFGIDEGGNEQETEGAGVSAETPLPADADAPSGGTSSPGDPLRPPGGTGDDADAADEGSQAEQEQAEYIAGTAETSENERDENREQDDQSAGTAKTSRVQSPEENAKYAAARRKAEAQRDAAVEEARRSAQEEAKRLIDEAFRNSGLTNPYTQQPITTKEEYEAYRQRYNAERKDRVLKKSGMSDEEFDAFVSDLPEVKAAREAQAAAERAQREANEAQARVKMDEQLREIGKLNPNIRELRDLAAMETYPKFYELVKRGNTLVDAYRLANFEALTNSAAQATRQAAINSVQSKQHMGATRERGTGTMSVPADVKEMYRALNPGATDAEIQSHYNRAHRKS